MTPNMASWCAPRGSVAAMAAAGGVAGGRARARLVTPPHAPSRSPRRGRGQARRGRRLAGHSSLRPCRRRPGRRSRAATYAGPGSGPISPRCGAGYARTGRQARPGLFLGNATRGLDRPGAFRVHRCQLPTVARNGGSSSDYGTARVHTDPHGSSRSDAMPVSTVQSCEIRCAPPRAAMPSVSSRHAVAVIS